MATQAQLDAAFAWAKAQVGKTYVLGSFGSSFDCSTYMSGIATMIRDGVAKRWFTTHPFHSGARNPLPGWERDLQSPFMIGITAKDIGHTGGTLLGVNFEATAADGRRVRMGPTARGALHSMYEFRYGFRPALIEGATAPTRIVWMETGPNKNPEYNKVVQRALFKEYGTVVVDGVWGMQTSTYYKRWQQSLGWPGDGLPGADSLTRLGAKHVFTVDIGGVVISPPETPTPTPEEPEVPTVGGTVVFNEVGAGRLTNSNKIVQKALNYEFKGVVVDGIWGAQTSGAYKRWQQKLGFTGSAADGKPGRTSMDALAKKYKFSVSYSDSNPNPTNPNPVNGEPAHDYKRVTYGGRTVNQRTKDMLAAAAKEFGGPFSLTQGSYNRGVSASAGTHDGGGVVDISTSGMSAARREAAVQCLRRAGFAAWLRTPAQGFAYHIHACAIGDREMAGGAKNQVQSYFNGRNGLAGNGSDTNPPRPWPAWANKYNY